MKAPRRTNTDAILMAATPEAGITVEGGWAYLEDIAEATGLRIGIVRQTARFLADEYGALEQLPATRAVRLNPEGLERYHAVMRLHHPDHLWPEERDRVVQGLKPMRGEHAEWAYA